MLFPWLLLSLRPGKFRSTLCPVPERTRTDPERIAAWLAAERITHFQTVPSFARGCLPALGGLPDLGHLLLAGEPLTGELAGALRVAGTRRDVVAYRPRSRASTTAHASSGIISSWWPSSSSKLIGKRAWIQL